MIRGEIPNLVREILREEVESKKVIVERVKKEKRVEVILVENKTIKKDEKREKLLELMVNLLKEEKIPVLEYSGEKEIGEWLKEFKGIISGLPIYVRTDEAITKLKRGIQNLRVAEVPYVILEKKEAINYKYALRSEVDLTRFGGIYYLTKSKHESVLSKILKEEMVKKLQKVYSIKV
jgi:hypothetical protein